MARNFYDGTDAELYTGSNHFSSTITGSPTSYGLTAPLAVSYDAVNALYETAYLTAVNPDTRTKAAIAAKNTARTNLRKMASDFAKIIDATPAVTDAMKIELGLNVRKQPSPIPVPAEMPVLEVIERMGTLVQIKLHDGTGSRRGKPDGVAGASVFTFIGATPPVDVSGWEFWGNTGKTIVDVEFPITLAPGAIVWFTAFWFNPRLESGPGCAAVSAIIAGGAMQLAA